MDIHDLGDRQRAGRRPRRRRRDRPAAAGSRDRAGDGEGSAPRPTSPGRPSASPACPPTTPSSTRSSPPAASSPAEVDRQTIGFDSVPLLSAGRVDAATAFWNAEGVALREAGVPTREFRVDEFGAPRYPELVLVTTAERLDGRSRSRSIVVARGPAGRLRERPWTTRRRRSMTLLAAVPGLERGVAARPARRAPGGARVRAPRRRSIPRRSSRWDGWARETGSSSERSRSTRRSSSAAEQAARPAPAARGPSASAGRRRRSRRPRPRAGSRRRRASRSRASAGRSPRRPRRRRPRGRRRSASAAAVSASGDAFTVTSWPAARSEASTRLASIRSLTSATTASAT